MSRPSIIAPGHMAVEVFTVESPLAAPLSVALPGAGKVNFIHAGGLTKLETLAGHIAGGLSNPAFFRERGSDGIAHDAVTLAVAVLARCQKVAEEQLAAKQQAEHEAALAAGVKPLEAPDEAPKSKLIV